MQATIEKIKADQRITHSRLDDTIADEISSCLADLSGNGVASPSEADARILSALKLWCRAHMTDDTAKAAAYMQRYDALKSSLVIARGYGGAQ